MRHDFVSIDRVFKMVERDLTSDFDEGDIIEWTGEALSFMETVHSYEEAVAFIEVSNFTARMPKFTTSIIQVARNNKWTPANKECVTPAKCLVDMPNLIYKNCGSNEDSGYVVLDCKGQPLVEYGVAYYRPYFDLMSEYYGWTNCKFYRDNYTPVRLSTNTFFNTLVCKETNYDQIYHSCKDEYKPVGKSALRLSFETGSIAVAYTRTEIDKDTGYPKVPDSASHLRAIVSYIATRMSSKGLFNQREGIVGVNNKFEADWQWYCRQAMNSDKMPQTIDEYQNLKDSINYLLPRERYYDFFGNLNTPEIRKWNDPDGRNHRNVHFD